jgi:hypothetical protein
MTHTATVTTGAPCKTVPCKECAQPIFIARTDNDKLMPVDALPNPERGNLRVWRDEHDKMRVEVLRPADRPRHGSTADLYLSHFATCTNPKRFRKRSLER